MDHFNDVRLYSEEKHGIGVEHEIWLRKHLLGVCSIAAGIKFKYKDIRDVLGFTIFGKPAHHLAHMLKTFYPFEKITDDTIFIHIVWHYTKRNMPVQDALIADWWREKQQSNSYELAIQQTLGL